MHYTSTSKWDRDLYQCVFRFNIPFPFVPLSLFLFPILRLYFASHFLSCLVFSAKGRMGKQSSCRISVSSVDFPQHTHTKRVVQEEIERVSQQVKEKEKNCSKLIKEKKMLDYDRYNILNTPFTYLLVFWEKISNPLNRNGSRGFFHLKQKMINLLYVYIWYCLWSKVKYMLSIHSRLQRKVFKGIAPIHFDKTSSDSHVKGCILSC